MILFLFLFLIVVVSVLVLITTLPSSSFRFYATSGWPFYGLSSWGVAVTVPAPPGVTIPGMPPPGVPRGQTQLYSTILSAASEGRGGAGRAGAERRGKGYNCWVHHTGAGKCGLNVEGRGLRISPALHVHQTVFLCLHTHITSKRSQADKLYEVGQGAAREVGYIEPLTLSSIYTWPHSFFYMHCLCWLKLIPKLG